MTYVYEIMDGPDKGKTFEAEQSIKDQKWSFADFNGRMCRVRRVIAGGTNFILKGDCWGKHGYERGIQSPLSKEDRANLDKPVK
jgi:hypothetical protein